MTIQSNIDRLYGHHYASAISTAPGCLYRLYISIYRGRMIIDGLLFMVAVKFYNLLPAAMYLSFCNVYKTDTFVNRKASDVWPRI